MVPLYFLLAKMPGLGMPNLKNSSRKKELRSNGGCEKHTGSTVGQGWPGSGRGNLASREHRPQELTKDPTEHGPACAPRRALCGSYTRRSLASFTRKLFWASKLSKNGFLGSWQALFRKCLSRDSMTTLEARIFRDIYLTMLPSYQDSRISGIWLSCPWQECVLKGCSGPFSTQIHWFSPGGWEGKVH